MKSVLRAAGVVLRRELRAELRTGEATAGSALFAVLVVVLASLAFYLDPSSARDVSAGVFWVAVAFGGVLAMSRSWGRERQEAAFEALLGSPAPRAGLYLGKAASALLFVGGIELLLGPLVALFFDVGLGAHLVPLALVALLGTVGFVGAGTLFASLAIRSRRGGELLVSVVVFPLLAPVLLAATVASREVLSGAGWPELLGWFRVLGGGAVLFVGIGLLLFEPLVAD